MDNLQQKLKESKGMVMQLISDTELRGGEDLSFGWNIGYSNKDEIIMKLNFKQPGLVSSRGYVKDRIRIIFQNTEELLSCVSLEQASIEQDNESRRELKLKKKRKFEIPDKTSIMIELPQLDVKANLNNLDLTTLNLDDLED